MTKLQDKAQAQVKQMVGQMIGDERLTEEGRNQQEKANRKEEDPSGRQERERRS